MTSANAPAIRRANKDRRTGIVRDCHGTPILGEAKVWEVDNSSGLTAARWVDALPLDDDKLDAFITRGYAAGTSGQISGAEHPQTWAFFEDLPSALVYGRAARMSHLITGYGVYEAAYERRYVHTQGPGGGDRKYLWLLRRSALDRQEGETEHFQTWVAGINPRDTHWDPKRAGLAVDEDQQKTISSRYLNTGSWQLPVGCRKLPDGRSTADVINSMSSELSRRLAIGDTSSLEETEWSGAVGFSAANGGTWGHMSLDALGYGKIPARIADHLHRITWHAGGRMWAMGFEGSIIGGQGSCVHWSAHYPRDDAAAVLLAAMSLILTENPAAAEWYLSSTCKGLCNLHEDKSAPICPTRWCGFADPDAECTCPCNGANHAKSTQGIPAGSLALDWASIPAEHLGWGDQTKDQAP